MKKIIYLVFLITSISIFAQVPSYYNDVNLNLTGNSLKDELANKIISTHTTFLSYTPGVWNALKQTDLDPNDTSKVLLIYGYSDTDGDYKTDRTRSKNANGGSAGSQWNREHTYPKSLGNPNLGTSGPGADAHHLRASDISRNSLRGNLKFANGSGNSKAVSGGWYPGDEWKGDVARMMMYMYLRYGNQCLPNRVGTGASSSSDANMLQLFLQWNAEDPVSVYEKQRNPVLENLQGNRNPFIDNPAFATKIWGGPQAEDLFGNDGGNNDTQAPTTPENIIATVNLNDVNLTWVSSSDNIAVAGYKVYLNNNLIATVSTTTYTANDLSVGTYSFSVKAFDAAGNESNYSDAIEVTIIEEDNGGGNGTTNELLISEYVEGSSYNKAIEIVNFTGSTVNLSEYSLKKVSNGNGSWSSTTTLSGTLANGDVFVVAHDNAATEIKDKADLTTSEGVINFNGNDAVGLFKNEILIDVLGNSNSSENFAKDKTLQRKSSVTSPNTTYTISEWISLSKNTFSGLGNHSINGQNQPDTEKPTIPEGIVVTVNEDSVDINWTASSDNVGVIGYKVYINDNFIATSTTTNYTATNLAPGTYSFSVTAYDATENESDFSDVVVATIIEDDNGGGNNNGLASELLISEYVEGSSFNKAIEIANFTGNDIDLSNYSLKRGANGKGIWFETTTLSGTLTNGSVYVVAHDKATAEIKEKADLTISDGVINFNGNDAVGLFKNDVLIDLLGDINSSANFAKDKTLQRKSSVSSPNTSYTTSEWIFLDKNTFSGLGSHSISDNVAPTNPTNLTGTNITETSVMLNWDAASDNVAIASYEVYKNEVKIASVTDTEYLVTDLDADTTYSFYVKAIDNSENSSEKSNVITITTIKSISYCISKGKNTSYEYIDLVALGDMTNNSNADNGYADFTSKIANVSYGTNAIVVSAGFSGFCYTESWKAWIDFNQNGIFENNEQILCGSSFSSKNLSATFNIPASAKTGKTRMRVSMKWFTSPKPCESFAYGEVEDYTVVIGNSSRKAAGYKENTVAVHEKLGNDAAIFSAKVHPNPTTDILNINLNDNRSANYKIINYIGNIIKSGKVSRTINIADLQNGIYILEINDGQRSFYEKIVKE